MDKIYNDRNTRKFAADTAEKLAPPQNNRRARRVQAALNRKASKASYSKPAQAKPLTPR